MKHVIFACLILFFFQSFLFSQATKYNETFRAGYYMAQDSSLHKGFLKIYPVQLSKLRFKSSEDAEQIKLPPEEVLEFGIDTATFRQISDVNAIGALGMKKNIKWGFGEIVSTGKINAFFVYLNDYDPFSGAVVTYVNLLLQKPNGEQMVVPILHRLKKKRIEKVKTSLIAFFGNEPYWTEKIAAMERNNGLFETMGIVREYNGENP